MECVRQDEGAAANCRLLCSGRAVATRPPQFAAALFTEVGGDVVAFGVEEFTR